MNMMMVVTDGGVMNGNGWITILKLVFLRV